MVGITSTTGLGSGLDINGLVQQVVTAETAPGLNRLDRQEARIQARLSAIGTFKGALANFQSSLSGVKGKLDFETYRATSSDESVATVTAASGAASGKYVLDVTRLSAAHSLTTDPALTAAAFTSETDIVGTGTLTFKFGTTVYDPATDTYTSFAQNPDKGTQTLTITDGSLKGIRDAINGANMGVSASIIYDGSHYRLAINSTNGAASSMEITVSDDDGNDTDASGLSLLAFNGTATHMQQTTAGQDAQVTLNGIAVDNPTDTLTETVGGLTIALKSIGKTTIDVTPDIAQAQSAITGFVRGYNDLVETMNEMTSYDPETRRAGPLQGEITVLTVRSQLSQILSTPIEAREDSPYRILADIGITLDSSNGTMKIDQTKLEESLRTNPEAVAELFGAQGTTTDPQIEYDSSRTETHVGRYDVNVTRIATQGTLVGSAAANLTITAGTNDTLTTSIDGVVGSVSLTPGTYTAQTLAIELQTQINGLGVYADAGIAVTVTQSAGILTLTSNRYGSSSSVDITGGNGLAGLLGASPVATSGVDVAGKIGLSDATGDGRYLTGDGAATGLKLKVTGGATGPRGSVTLSRGFAERIDVMLTSLIGTEGTIDDISQGIDKQLERLGDDRDRLLRRRDALQARLQKEFIALDGLVGQLRATSKSLASQLASIPKIGR